MLSERGAFPEVLEECYDQWADANCADGSRASASIEAQTSLLAFELDALEAAGRVWPFDELYPEFLTQAHPVVYDGLDAFCVERLGDTVPRDRGLLPRADVMPWITPGDSGVCPGDFFRYAVLEGLANGARGTHFWSGRVWDAESLGAYAAALRVVGQVEDAIVDGQPIDPERVVSEPSVRVSGQAKDGEMFLLLADYRCTRRAEIHVRLLMEGPVAIADLETGRPIATVSDAAPFRIVLQPTRRAVPLHVRPVSASAFPR